MIALTLTRPVLLALGLAAAVGAQNDLRPVGDSQSGPGQ